MATLRVVSFNIQHGRRPDGVVDLDLVRRECAGFGANVLVIQEIDCRVRRSRFKDQAAEIERWIGLHCSEGYARKVGLLGRSGSAVFTSEPPVSTELAHLPNRNDEVRVAVVVRLTEYTVIGTHLSWDSGDRGLQWRALERIVNTEPGPLVLMGDLNAHPKEAVPRIEAMGLTVPDSDCTWPASEPTARIDYCGLRGFEAERAEVRPEPVSDHRALVVDVLPARFR